MKALALMACLGLAACAGHDVKPEPDVRPFAVATPVARSCVPAGLAPTPSDYPATLAAFTSALRAAPDVAARYQLLGGWALGMLGRLGEVEPVVAGCRKVEP